MDIERAIESVGSCGLWHVWVYFWIFYAVCFFAAVNLCIVFMQYIPDYVCENPLTNLTNWTFQDIQKISTPKHTVGDEYNGCLMYDRNYTDISKLGSTFEEVYSKIFGNDSTYDVSNDTIACPYGPYDWNIGEGMHLSIANQWNLVCDQAFQVSNTSTAYMVGFFFGCLCASFLADRFGRKKVFMASATAAGILGVIDPWMSNFYVFIVGRFLMAFALTVGSPTLYVLCLELCTESVRKPMGALYFISYSVGYAGLAGVAYFIRDWRVLHTICAAALLIGPFFYWLIPESPRWLVSQGREEEAIKVLKWAAKWNKKKTAPENMKPAAAFRPESPAPAGPVKSTESTNFFLVFRHWKLALRTLNIWFNWIVNTFVYYGISYLITSFSGNIFLNNAISGALETPAYLLCYPLLFWARKKSLMLLLIIAGVSLLLYLPVQNGPTWAQLLVAFVGKLAITASFNLIFLVTVELYHTPVRGASVAMGSMTARIGAIAAPWVVLIGQKNKALVWIPMVIYGAFSLAAGILTFFLPESQNQPLPETLEEAINYPPKRKPPPSAENPQENVEFTKF